MGLEDRDKVGLGTALISLLSGGVCGYLHANKIPIPHEFVNIALLGGPVAIKTSARMVQSVIKNYSENAPSYGIYGFISGAAQTGVGYGLGYAIGSLVNFIGKH